MFLCMFGCLCSCACACLCMSAFVSKDSAEGFCDSCVSVSFCMFVYVCVCACFRMRAFVCVLMLDNNLRFLSLCLVLLLSLIHHALAQSLFLFV